MNWGHLGNALFAMVTFGLLGVLLLLVGYKLFDMLIPSLHFPTELGEKRNMAVAVVIASFILGVSAIIVAAIVG